MGFKLFSPSSGSQPFPGATCDDVLDVGSVRTDQNNFAPGPAGSFTFENASTWEIDCQLAFVLSGMQGGYKGRRVVLVNVGIDNISIPNESNDSAAANRFNFSATILAGACIVVQYSGILSRWVLVAGGSSPASSLSSGSEFDGADEWDGASVSLTNGSQAGNAGGSILLSGGFSNVGFGGNITLATGHSDAGDAFVGNFQVQLGNNVWLTVDFVTGASFAAGIPLGFFGAAPVGVQSITGATTQLQVDSIVAALVAFGLVTDDR